MTSSNRSSLQPDFFLILSEEDGRPLTVGNDTAPAVFSGEGEAALFLRFGIGDGKWRVRRIPSGELLALLIHDRAGFTSVALDPLPGMTAESLAGLLVDVGRYPFVGPTPVSLAAS